MFIKDKKYRASFKQMHLHKCWLTNCYFTEFGSHSITGCHITLGRYARGMKPSDDLIIPLRQDMHLQMDVNQKEFLELNCENFPPILRDLAIDKVGEDDAIEIVKQMARNYYQEWKAANS